LTSGGEGFNLQAGGSAKTGTKGEKREEERKHQHQGRGFLGDERKGPKVGHDVPVSRRIRKVESPMYIPQWKGKKLMARIVKINNICLPKARH